LQIKSDEESKSTISCVGRTGAIRNKQERRQEVVATMSDLRVQDCRLCKALTCIMIAFLAFSTHDVHVGHFVSMDELVKVVVHCWFGMKGYVCDVLAQDS
jgi:hypothetical protein